MASTMWEYCLAFNDWEFVERDLPESFKIVAFVF